MNEGSLRNEPIRRVQEANPQKLARLADVALNTVAKIEAGESKHPTIQTMAGIAKALGVSLDDLAKGCLKNT